jgi:hypothetical protein
MTGDDSYRRQLDSIIPRPARWNLPGRALDALLRWSMVRNRARELQALDHGLPAARMTAVRAAVLLGACVAFFATEPAGAGTPLHWLHLLAQVFLFAYAGAGVLAPVGRAQAFGYGWREGRRAFWISGEEARRRGMTLPEWLDAELTRDAAREGITLPDGGPDDREP